FPPHMTSPALFPSYQPIPLNDAAVPPFPAQEQDDEDDTTASGNINLDFEIPSGEWRAIPPGEPSGPLPRRFIDGSIQSRTVASLLVEQRQRPVLAAVASAGALRLDRQKTSREPGARLLRAIAVNSNGIAASELDEARRILAEQGIELLVSEAEKPADFD